MSPTPEQVKEARAKAGLTQQQAADLVGVTITAWQYWEYGQRHMSAPAWRLFQLLTKG